MKSAMLVLICEEEHADLVEWITRDDADDSAPYWHEAGEWLQQINDHGLYPYFAAVPSEYIDAIEAVIADWCEVLSQYEDADPFQSEIIRARRIPKQ